jgi:FkbM family methyltransferase
MRAAQRAPEDVPAAVIHEMLHSLGLGENPEDDASRSLLVQVLAYRALGPHRCKLPLNTTEYWSQRKALKRLIQGTDSIDINFLGMPLGRMSLSAIGYPIELYFSALGAMNTFVLKQYQYSKHDPHITAQSGDYVIDAGGCYGDAALYFANEVGAQGRVFSFEFAPANLAVQQRNIDLNPILRPRIEVVDRALWDTSGHVFHYCAFGPATQISDARTEGFDGSLRVNTVSVDDFVRERRLPRVDFIKMDIEGAEPRAGWP